MRSFRASAGNIIVLIAAFLNIVMNKMISVALLVGGIVLIVLGITATNSFSSDVSRFFTGSPTDKAIWLLIGGIVAASLGGFGLFRSPKGA